MSQKYVNLKKIPYNKGISIMKTIERFNEEMMKKDIGSGANDGEASSESYVGSSTIGKEFVPKKKVVKKRTALKHDSDS